MSVFSLAAGALGFGDIGGLLSDALPVSSFVNDVSSSLGFGDVNLGSVGDVTGQAGSFAGDAAFQDAYNPSALVTESSTGITTNFSGIDVTDTGVTTNFGQAVGGADPLASFNSSNLEAAALTNSNTTFYGYTADPAALGADVSAAASSGLGQFPSVSSLVGQAQTALNGLGGSGGISSALVKTAGSTLTSLESTAIGSALKTIGVPPSISGALTGTITKGLNNLVSLASAGAVNPAVAAGTQTPNTYTDSVGDVYLINADGSTTLYRSSSTAVGDLPVNPSTDPVVSQASTGTTTFFGTGALDASPAAVTNDPTVPSSITSLLNGILPLNTGPGGVSTAAASASGGGTGLFGNISAADIKTAATALGVGLAASAVASNPAAAAAVALGATAANLLNGAPNTAAGGLQSTLALARQQQTNRLQQQVPAQSTDWRVKLSLAANSDYLYNDRTPGSILWPLYNTNGVIFPYTPSIDTAYHAVYSNYDLVHSNYRGYFYQNSYVDAINIKATFTAQDTNEANYLLAVIHFFRSVTKMFYGQDAQRGTPPPLVFLSGLGDFQFNQHPAVVSQFNYTLPSDVDYIRAQSISNNGTNQLTSRNRQTVLGNPVTNALQRLTSLGQGIQPGAVASALPLSAASGASLPAGNPTYVPTKMDISITLLPIQSRAQVSNQFSLKSFAQGNQLKGGFW